MPGFGPVGSHPVAAVPEDVGGPFDPAIFDPAIFDTGSRAHLIDSADWTGIEARLAADPALVEAIRNHVEQLDRLIERSHLTNEERAQAKATTAALVSLVHAPRPEWKVIIAILGGTTFTALCNAKDIAEIVGALFKLILGV